MGENCIINGGFTVDQRFCGAAKTYTAGNDYEYGPDMWFGYCTGANVTGQQINGGYGNRKEYQFTGAASVTAIGFGTRIKAADCYHLNGAAAMLSVDMSNSLLTSVTWTAYYANGNDAFGTKASPTKTQIATGTLTVSAGNTRYDISLGTIPNAACTGIEIIFSVGAQTSGTWVFGNVDLYAGNAARAFTPRMDTLEKELCRAHYEKSFLEEVAPVTNSGSNNGESHFVAFAGGATNTYAFIPYKTPKYRQSSGGMPPVTLYNPKAANAQVRDLVSATDCSGTTVSGSVWDKGFQIRTTGNAATAANNILAINWVCEANIL